MRAVVACLWLAACGPGLTIVPSNKVRETLTAASGDAVAIEKLLHGSVMNGGLWFADEKCATFAKPGPVAADRYHDFARCLADVHFVTSDRVDQLPDVTVMTYAPGIEIEARVAFEQDGPRLSWIGFESRRDESDSLPTISPTLLESLRSEGNAKPAIADPKAYTWLKLCLDTDGSLASVTPFEASSPQAARELGSMVATWKFKPAPMGPVCSMVRLGQAPPKIMLPFPPPPGGDAIVTIPITSLHRTGGEINIVPDDDTKTTIGRTGIGRVIGSYRVCLDAQGRVQVVVPLRRSGFTAYDEKIVSTIKNKWQFEPYLDNNHPVPVCSAVTFIYSQF